MLNSGVYVEVAEHDRVPWYGVIEEVRGDEVIIRIGGMTRSRAVPRSAIRLHPTFLAMRAPARRREVKHVIVAGGNATGDLFGITIALLRNPTLGVLLLEEVSLSAPVDKTRSDSVGMNGQRVAENPLEVYQVAKWDEWAGLSPLHNEPVYDHLLTRHLIQRWDPRGKCKSADMERFLRDSLGPSHGYQIFVLPVEDTNHWYGKLTRGTAEQRKKAAFYAFLNARNATHGLYPALTGTTDRPEVDDISLTPFDDIAKGTRLLATEARQDLVRSARDAWQLCSKKFGGHFDGPCHELLQRLHNTAVKPADRYVVLWSRFSGKRGGPHPQHDTSYEGLGQLIELVHSRGLGVILAGDRSWTPEKRHKPVPHQDLAEWDLREVWMTQEWRRLVESVPADNHRFKNPRILQIYLFDYLNRTADRIVDTKTWGAMIHLGMRSGNLEAFALAGHRVYYMEEVGNEEHARMEAWHTPKSGNADIGPRYDRILLKEPPTRTGKYIVHEQRRGNEESDNKIHPWRRTQTALEERPKVKSEALGKKGLEDSRGFIEADLTTIAGYMDLWTESDMRINGYGFSYWTKG